MDHRIHARLVFGSAPLPHFPIATAPCLWYNHVSGHAPRIRKKKVVNAMKMLRQFLIIALVSLAGEALRALIPLPVPGSVYGLVLMLALLCAGVLKVDQVKGAASFLIEIMPVMFIPAAVGLLDTWDALKPVFWPVILITCLTTVFVMAVTGRVTQRVIGGKGADKP